MPKPAGHDRRASTSMSAVTNAEIATTTAMSRQVSFVERTAPTSPIGGSGERSNDATSRLSRWSRSSTSSAAIGVAVLRIASHRLQHDRLERGRHLRIAFADGIGILVQVPGHHDHPIVAPEGHAPRQELVHHHSPGVDVAAAVAPASLNLLRAHVVGSAEALGEMTPRQSFRAFDQRGAEVDHLQMIVGRHDDVLGLQVAVHDPVPVHVHEHRGELPAPADREIDRHGTREVAQSPPEALALDVLEHEIRLGSVGTVIETVHDTRMIEREGDLRFPAEAPEGLRDRRTGRESAPSTRRRDRWKRRVPCRSGRTRLLPTAR